MTIYNWMCVLGIPSLIAGLLGFVRLQVKANKAMRLAVQAMLRDRLLLDFRRCAAQEYADSDERQNFENMYVQYHALGGNGVMDDIRHKFFDLPIQ